MKGFKKFSHLNHWLLDVLPVPKSGKKYYSGIETSNIIPQSFRSDKPAFCVIKRRVMEKAENKKRDAAAIVFLLVGILSVVVLRSPGMLKGELLVPVDSLWMFAPWRLHRPDAVGVENSVLTDVIQQFYPWTVALHRSLQDGIIPLWNPDVYCGAPFLANLQSQVMHPFRLLFLPVLGPDYWFCFIMFWRFSAAAFFTYLFMRKIGISRLSGIFGGFVFSLGGYVTVWAAYPKIDAVVLLPAVLYFTESYLQRKNAVSWAFLSFFIGLQFLAGHIETTFLLSAFPIIYGVLGSFRREKPVTNLSGLIAAWVTASFFAASAYLPFSEYLFESARMRMRASQTGAQGTLPFYTAISWLFPDRFGSPIVNYGYHGPRNYNEITGYIGIVALVPALAGLFSARRPMLRISALMVFAFGLTYGLPVISLAAHVIPGWRFCWLNRMLAPAGFFLAVLAGEGLDRLQKKNKGIMTAAFFLAGVFVAAFFCRHPSPGADEAAAIIHRHNIILHVLFAVAAAAVVTFIKRRGVLIMIFLALIDLCFFGWGYLPTQDKSNIFPVTPEIESLKEAQAGGRMTAVHPSLLPESGLVYGLRYVDGHDSLIPWRIDRLLKELREDPEDRWTTPLKNFQNPLWDVMGVRGLLTQYPPVSSFRELILNEYESQREDIGHFGEIKGVRVVSSMEVRKRIEKGETAAVLNFEFPGGEKKLFPVRFGLETDDYAGGQARLHRVVTGKTGRKFNFYEAVFQWEEPLKPSLCIIEMKTDAGRLIVDFIEPLDGKWRFFARDAMYVYENIQALPKAVWISEAKYVSDEEALNMLVSGGIEPGGILLLPPAYEDKIAGGSSNGRGTCKIEKQSRHEVVIKTESDEAGFLFCNQTFFPGRKASIDGRSAQILRAHYAFTAVNVPPGTHKVRLTYEPFSFRWGLFLSLLSLTVITGVLCVKLRERIVKPFQ